jgi:hypothetical protein
VHKRIEKEGKSDYLVKIDNRGGFGFENELVSKIKQIGMEKHRPVALVYSDHQGSETPTPTHQPIVIIWASLHFTNLLHTNKIN